MPKGLPQNVKDNIDKCQAAALAAVEAYNRPGRRFRTAQYIVMITIAWTALFHAIFFHRRRRPWYRKRTSGTGRGVRYVKVDGEPKYWELSECLRQYYGDKNPPERKNLEFLVGLRNKIEHRHIPELDASLYGECQAALLNLEEAIVQEFGQKYALTEDLAVSLQFSRQVPAEKKRTAKVLATGTAKTVKEYIEKFRGDLPSSVLSSMKYSFNIFLVPKVANRESAADAAVQFVHINEASDEELKRLEKLNVLIKEKHIPIANLDLYKPSQVVQELAGKLPYEINMATHTAAWKHYKVRPPYGTSNPKKTRPEYCLYDEAHADYLYTRAWVEMLVRELSTEETFTTVIGRKPIEK
ncbi:MAG: DUF3644 domain-containing protein [gamma proteobacterium symbiont of Ctena orbiculata]|nr:MAG: DUF3644 domain-containing protein [gamma proteobacterium symbiont of Ctena orbiculata]